MNIIVVASGLCVSMIGMPYMLKMYSGEGTSAYWRFNIIVVLFTLVFTFLAVYISARKPAKIISSLTAVESIRYMNNNEEIKKKRLKTSDKHSIITTMAYRCVTSNKKRSALVTISLTLGLLIFIIISTVVNSISPEKYVASIIDATVVIGNNAEADSDGSYNRFNVVDNKMLDKISGFKGVDDTYISKRMEYTTDITDDMNSYLKWMNDKFETEPMEPQKATGCINSISTEQLGKYLNGSSDLIEKYKTGKYYFIDKGYQKNFTPPKEIDAVLNDGSHHKYKFGGYIDIQMFICYENDVGLSIIVPETEYNKICVGNDISDSNIYVYASSKNEDIVCKKINDYLGMNNQVEFETVQDVREECKFMIAFLTIAGNGTSFVFILLGIMNFINLMSASVQSRKSELSMLESIGMTKKQIIGMLIREGLSYSIVSIAIVLTAGYAFTRYTVHVISSSVEFASYDFPGALVDGICFIVLLICVLVPYFMYRSIAKNELSYRIRYE